MEAKKIKRETWRTTDAEERAKRQERAKIEPMKVRAVDASDAIRNFCDRCYGGEK